MFGTSFQKSVFLKNDLPELDSLVQIKNRDNLSPLNCSDPIRTERDLTLPGRSGTSTVSGDSAGEFRELDSNS